MSSGFGRPRRILPAGDPRHGSTKGWHARCSCERCRRAWADYIATYRATRAAGASR